ncbi:MAG: DUF1294 domain-containing protein [Defluviitaleaceae bacterium]|nr:DUF1294 domain-containing protein [Defluviitaleaceae bacterium]
MDYIIDAIFDFTVVKFFAIFFALINIISFSLYAIDKKRASKGQWRIKEGTLILFTVFFGGIGGFLGMSVLRHKTTKPSFKLAAAIGLIVALAAIAYIAYGIFIL